MKKKIRILQLGSPTDLYGAERWILALSKYLDKTVFDVRVAVVKDTLSDSAQLCSEADKLGISSYIFKSIGKMNVSSIRLVKNFIITHGIDIIHSHGYKTDAIAYFSTRGTSCRVLSTPHGWSRCVDLKLRLYEFFDRCIFFFFDAVVPLSEDLYQSLKRLPGLGKKLHLIPNGVDVSEIDGVEHTESRITSWKNNGNFIFGYIGQLIPRKGLDILFTSLSRLKVFNWKLVIIGDGVQRQELKKLALQSGIEGNVHFMGFRKDRISFLKAFDLFVLPSRLEGIPRCIMEAMAAKVPVLASDIPGCRELISHEQTGLLFTCDNVDSLCRNIERILGEPELMEYLAENARTFVVQNYSAEIMAGSYKDLYVFLTGIRK